MFDPEMEVHTPDDTELNKLARILRINRDEFENSLDSLLVDLGVDSLQISTIQGILCPAPTLIELYNGTLRTLLKMIQSSTANALEQKKMTHSDDFSIPFKLMEMQESYYIGRYESPRFCPCQAYSEFDFEFLDIPAFEKALQHVLQRHPMLRVKIIDEQYQQVTAPPVEGFITKILHDESRNSEEVRNDFLSAFKKDKSCFWKVEATQLPAGGIRLHVLFDMIFLDATSALIIGRDIADAYNSFINGIEVSNSDETGNNFFHDYCKLMQSQSESADSRHYWMNQIATMPGPPQLPRIRTEPICSNATFKRISMELNANIWNALKTRAKELKVTTTALLLGAFQEVVRFFSQESSFTLTLTTSERVIGNRSFVDVVGDFTNVLLLGITDEPSDFMMKIKLIHQNLAEGLEHKDMSGLKVMRLLKEKFNDPALNFPVVFTSLLGLDVVEHKFGENAPSLAFQQTQTPQVWLDHQVYEMGVDENSKILYVNWDFDTNFYCHSLIDSMNTAYVGLLKQLSLCLNMWTPISTQVSIPPAVLEMRIEANTTEKAFESDFILHNLIQAKRTPEKIAVIDQVKLWTYEEVDKMATTISSIIQSSKVCSGDCVAVILEKGWEQIVSVLGILRAGAVYIPINPSDPDFRISSILDSAGCSLILSQTCVMIGREWNIANKVVITVSPELFTINHLQHKAVVLNPDSLAYVIYTSGTEGVPKGVEITHRSVVNTIVDIIERFDIKDSDTIFALSSLSFDLSVWDIFGVLGAGGTVVICKPSGTRDPEYWWTQVERHKVTLWNSVPTSFEMLMETLPSNISEKNLTLRTIFLSGDAIRTEFVRTTKLAFTKLRIICLGGATEASIWSNFHEYILCRSPNVELVPYGKPLSNQTMYVLDSLGQYRNTNVTGEIFIGGVGIARGYFKDPRKTNEKFIQHPVFGRLYSTGDLGYYRENGEIQILGRKDAQIKLGGHRVELAEIEHCVEQVAYVKRAAVVCTNGVSKRLVGFVQLKQNTTNINIEQDLKEQTALYLPDYMIVQTWLVLSSMPLSSNGKIDRKKLCIPDIAQQDTASAESDVISIILQIAREFLSDDKLQLTPSCSLVEFGMTSLTAIRFSKKLAEVLGVQLPYTLVFNYPTIAQIADKISGHVEPRISKLDRSIENLHNEPIAVVGMACRLPGEVSNPEAFWKMLTEGKDCVSDVPITRFDINDVYHAVRGSEGKSYTKRGAFMKDVDWFDHELFGISIAEARTMDPQQRLILEVGYEAFVRAGYDKTTLENSNTGVFVGQMNYDWMRMTEYSHAYAGTGVAPSITANRISFTLGLRGPSITIDTACSSSLVALDIAVDKLRAGKCSLALVAGVNVILDADPYLTTCAAGMLSIDGRCATFDHSANGIVRGEGVGCVVLKTLKDAQTDGSNILAIVKGTAVNQDGRSATLTAPSSLAQEAVIRNALANAGIDGADVDYVECHGTGTSLGDPIEVEALKNVLAEGRNKPVVLGAVKTNIGHLEGAAGIAGLMKAILVLQHRQVPPNLHLHNLNPKIDVNGFKVLMPTALIALGQHCLENSHKTLVAGISSFGFGGTNAHAILQSWPQSLQQEPKLGTVLWLYTGQGSQYSAMGYELYQTEISFKIALDLCADYLSTILDIPLHPLLFDTAQRENLNNTRYAQPAILSLEFALSEMWQTKGITPTIVIGHSVGEFAAAIVCGVLSLKNALELVCARGKLMDELCAPEAMAEVHCSVREIQEKLTPSVVLAAVNGPTSIVLSGNKNELEAVLDSITFSYKWLPVEHGYYSSQMHVMLDKFEEKVKAVNFREPSTDIIFISTVTGTVVTSELCTSEYWVKQIRQTVNFLAAMQLATTLRIVDTIIEIGPKPILTQMAKKFIESSNMKWMVAIENEGAEICNGLCSIPQKAHFDRKHLPWKVQKSPMDSSKQIYDCLFETEWASLKLQNFSPSKCKMSKESISIFDSRWLILSMKTISVTGTNWLNVVHDKNIKTNTHSENCQRRCANLLIDMEDLLKEEPWETVLLDASGGEDLHVVELGFRLLNIISNQPTAPEVWFLTRSESQSTNDTDFDYSGAGLWALARTAAIEVPEIRIRCIETTVHMAASEIAKLCQVVRSHGMIEETEYKFDKKNDLKVLRLKRISFEEMANSMPVAIKQNVTYIISGGNGALGQVCANWLIDVGATHIVLLSRNAKSVEPEQLLARTQHKSVNIMTMQCDVSSQSAVQKIQDKLDSLYWPVVKGVIHAAGVLCEGGISNQDKTKLEFMLKSTFNPKVEGAKNLRTVFKPCDFLILFSSVDALFGSPGVGHYAAANATMDEIARKWHRKGEKVLCIQWGAWSECGMAVRNNAIQSFERSGYGTITNTLGIRLLKALLTSSKFGVVCATPIAWSQFLLRRTFCTNILSEEVSGYNMRHTHQQNIEEIQDIVKAVVFEVFGMHIANNSPLMEAGMSSLDLVSLRHLLVKEFPTVIIPSSIVFNYPTIHDITMYIKSQCEKYIGIEECTPPNISVNYIEWQKISNRESGRPIFLVGGVLGTPRGTFERLVELLPCQVFSLVPNLVALPTGASINTLAKEYVLGMRKIQPRGKVIVGGLSFGALLAMEMACLLEKQDLDQLELLLLLEPRHTPPFTPPLSPATFETLVSSYSPSAKINGLVVLVKTSLPDFSTLSPLLQEAARSFQEDPIVSKNCKRCCPNLTFIDCPGHHFNFLNTYHETLAHKLLELPVNWHDCKSTGSNIAGEPIAVVGMSCRLPGGVSNPEEFWSMLQDGRDCISEVPISRFDMEDIYHPVRGTIGKSYTKVAGFMDNVEWFDNEYFNISLAEANAMDPQQRLLLEVAYEAFVRAGYEKGKLAGSNTGVFIGQANYDWMVMHEGEFTSPYYGPGASASITANRMSYILGLLGPSLTTDTACSSSLVALDLAVEKLRSKKCAQALVAGVNVILDKTFFVTSSAMQALSARGRCASFDASADGYCRGEGVGAVVLKLLSLAEAEGDNILAVIKGTAVNHDGRSTSLTAPSGLAQEAVIRCALNDAGVAGKDVDYVECHGTGTKLGDPIELEALKNVLGEGRIKPVVLGAVKTNIGHLEGAAGIIGMIKTILVLQHGAAPGNLHFNCLNPMINLNDFPAVIPTNSISLNQPLPQNENNSQKRLIAGVSSFGFGGTNVHAILQSWPGSDTTATIPVSHISYSRNFLPWYRIPHPLIYYQKDKCTFVGKLNPERVSLFNDHQIGNEMLIPAASHLTMVAGAYLTLHKMNISTSQVIQVTDIAITRPMRVIEGMNVHCSFIEGKAEIQWESNEIMEQCVQVGHVTMIEKSDTHISDFFNARHRCLEPIDITQMYEDFEWLGVKFGPSFRNVKEAWKGTNEMFGRIGLKNMKTWERSLSLIHPALLDAGFQLLAHCAVKVSGVCLPFHVEKVELTTQKEQEDLWVLVHLTGCSASSLTGNMLFVTANNNIVASVDGITCRRGGPNSDVSECMYEIEWVPMLNGQQHILSDQSQMLNGQQHIFSDQSHADAEPLTIEASITLSSLSDAKWLILSFSPVSLSGTKWVNIVHTASTSIVDIEQKRVNPDARSADLLMCMEHLIEEEPWEAIVLLASSLEEIQIVEVGIRLLQEIAKQQLLLQNHDLNISKPVGLPDIWFLTCHQQQYSEEKSDTEITGAGLWALARTARIELPLIRLRCMKCPMSIFDSKMAEVCYSVILQGGSQENEFIYQPGSNLLVPRLVRMGHRNASSHNNPPIIIRTHVTYAISGGLGSLATAVAKWLLAEGATHIVLLSRTKRTTVLDQIIAFHENNAKVEWIQCDVSCKKDLEQVQTKLVDMKWPVVVGVIHTAGVLNNGTIPNIDMSMLQTTFLPKVYGAINLRSTFMPSDFLILFSSAAAVFGSPGLANYAAANACMDALASGWKNNRENVLSLQWGMWSDGGMAAEEAILKRAERTGFGLIPDVLGVSILKSLLSTSKFGVVCATPIMWPRIQLSSTLYDHFKIQTFTNLSELHLSTTSIGLLTHQSEEKIREVVQNVAAEVIGKNISEDISLLEAGLDSLGALELRNRLSAELGVQLSSIFVYNYPTVSEIVTFLLSKISHTSNFTNKPSQNKRASPDDAIAIIGMSCRLPGSVSSPEEFWNMLEKGQDCVSEVPISRFDMENVYDPVRGKQGKSYTKRAAFMDNVEWFDNEIFNISLTEAKEMDPQQRLLLEVGYEAFCYAGYDKNRLTGSDTGVFVGQANYDWMTLNQKSAESPYFGAGCSASITSNRISYVFGLNGPSMTVDTACSSSLVALNLAVEKLKSGVCTVALVAGVNVMLSTLNFVGSCASNMLSMVGRCATFDASADGYCRGEGVGAIVLKPLHKAIIDGDNILALIKGTAVNQDGRSATLTAPNGIAQENVIHTALADAGILGKDVDYVECHGTGTNLGDPIEIEALKKVLGEGRKKPVVLGAVKTNIGHLEGAAGIIGLIKAVLVLQHGVAPSNIHFQTLNPKIDIEGFQVVIPTIATEFDFGKSGRHESPLVAGVSSFGFGGTNAHAVLQAYREYNKNASTHKILFKRNFIPWRRLFHPLIYNLENEKCFVSCITGQRATLWNDHCIDNEVWVPAASHLTMVAGAIISSQGHTLLNNCGVELIDFVLLQPTRVAEEMKIRCQLIEKGAEIWSEIKEIQEKCVSVADAKMTDGNMFAALDIENARHRCTESVNLDTMYNTFKSLGIQYGPSYRNITEAWMGQDEAVARVSLSSVETWERSLNLIHPALLDGGIQILGMCALNTSGLCVPFHIQRIWFSILSEQEYLWVYVHLTQKSLSNLTGNITFISAKGTVVAVIEGLTSQRMNMDMKITESLYQQEWLPLSAQTDVSEGQSDIPNTSKDTHITETLPKSLLPKQEKWLLLSFTPVSVEGTKWVNVVHRTEDTLAENKYDSNIQRFHDLKTVMDDLLKEEIWDAVVLISGTEQALKIMEVGLRLLQCVEKQTNDGRVPDVWFITSIEKPLISFTQFDGSGAGLWALARSARAEMPNLVLRCVEMICPTSAIEIASMSDVVLKNSKEMMENEFNFKQGKNLEVLRLIRMSPDSSKSLNMLPVQIKQNATYIISGGTGALALVFTKWLIVSGATHILLLSRKDRPNVHSELEQYIKQHSANVLWLKCDISKEDDVHISRQELHKLKWPYISGAIHAAGILSDGTIPSLKISSLLETFGAKVDGAKHIHNIFQPSDFLVLFSSAVVVFGSAGQAAYTAANATMDAMAKAWINNGEKVLCIQWGAWSEGGMASDPTTLKRADRNGFGAINNAMGVKILELLLAIPRFGLICAASISWNRIQLRSPLVSHFLTNNQSMKSSSILHKHNRAIQGYIETLAAVKKIAFEILGVDIEYDKPLMEAGMDSLATLEFKNKLSSEFGIQLPSVFVYNYPSLEAIVTFLVAQDSAHNDHLASEQINIKMDAIAIVGMSCRLPGGISSCEEFWSMLIRGQDCVSDIPVSRFDMSGVFDPVPGTPGKSYTKRAATMNDIEWFDNEFFDISYAEALSMDPQQRLLLEVGYEAFVNAGYDKKKLKGSNTGVFVGQMNYDWMMMNSNAESYAGTGLAPAITSNRMSYVLGLHGPSITLDTACSSSLVALDSAVDKLRAGKCSLAIVAGVNVILNPTSFVGLSTANMLSQFGRCATFDESADGYCRGEGVGAVILKPLSSAQKDGNKILAVIKGTAVNQDGRSATLTAPNGMAQEAAIKNALFDANLTGKDVDYIECHGTGTALGDPIEVEALRNILGVNRKKPVVLGAVKTNIGHLEGAAGIIGLIKTVMVLQHGIAPPNIHFNKLNPNINLQEFQAIIPTKLSIIKQPRGPLSGGSSDPQYLIAGISSFGYGGTNAHVILQEWPSDVNQMYKLGTNAWLFTGQGSHYSGMGHELYKTEASFRNALDICAHCLTSLMDISLLSLMFDEKHSDKLELTRYSQPAIFSLEFALYKLWQSRGISPNIVLGHSIGEFTAAVVSGVMDVVDALELVAARGQLMDEFCECGAMAAVRSSPEIILPPGITIAAVNGPNSIVLAGKNNALELTLQQLGVPFKLLPVFHGFHSPLMYPMLEDFRAKVKKIKLRKPVEGIQFVSTVTGTVIDTEIMSSDYWVNQICKPVLFFSAMQTILLQQNVDTFIEIGPKTILIPMAKRFADNNNIKWIESIHLVDPKNGKTTNDNFSRTEIFKRKKLPFPAPANSMKNLHNTFEQACDCVYVKQWVNHTSSATSMDNLDINLQNATENKHTVYGASSGSVTESRCLLLSHTPISVTGTNWLNVVHTNHTISKQSYSKIYDERYEDIQLRLEMLCEEENWNTIIYAASNVAEMLILEIGLRLLQTVEKMIKVGHVPNVCFVTQAEPNFTIDTNDILCTGACLWGLARSARIEMPEIVLRCVEISTTRAATEIADSLNYILEHGNIMENEFRYGSDGSLKVSRLMKISDCQNDSHDSVKNAHQAIVKSDVTYIISGGMGALAVVFARWLVDNGATHIALLSRKKKSIIPSEIMTLQSNHSLSIKWLQCDVSCLEDLIETQRILTTMQWPDIKGVIHTAGVLSDGTIPHLDPLTLQTTFCSKVDGAKNLHDVFMPPDFFILFSSTASVFGSPGQGSYAAANASMDALADIWYRNGEPVLSIQWGAWSESGMAANKRALRRAEMYGFGTISNSLGTRILEYLLEKSKFGVVCATPIHWNRLNLNSQLLSDMMPTELNVDNHSIDNRQLNNVSSVEIKAIVQSVAFDVLGVNVQDNAPLLEAGLDSLGAVEFRNRLSSELGMSLPSGILFSFPTIEDVTNHCKMLKNTNLSSKSSSTSLSTYPTLVIGAGLGGLSFAKELVQAGHHVIIMESQAELGGVWKTIANSSSKLQIDSPSYDFGCTGLQEIKTWPCTFPTSTEILNGVKKIASLFDNNSLLTNAKVKSVHRRADESSYLVEYTHDETVKSTIVGGVVALTGGLHKPRTQTYKGEESFQGISALGISNDVLATQWNNARVVIVGHGAFAIENMRTAFENGATHVTIICRKRNLVFSTFCNWMLNSSESSVPVNHIVEMMRPFYKAAGIDVNELHCLQLENGETYSFQQESIPAASDLYFLAQEIGCLKVIEDEIDCVREKSVVTKKGEEIPADILLKCLGFDEDHSILQAIFGKNCRVEGLWINDDPNLLTYSDAQTSSKVHSLLCSSYLFFIQAFVPAYLHYRINPIEFKSVLNRIQGKNAESSGGLMVELWDFLAPAKRKLSERTRLKRPFDKFLQEREREWDRYSKLLSNSRRPMEVKLWDYIQPVISEIHHRNPLKLIEERFIEGNSQVSVFQSSPKYRILFLHGQGTNAKIAHNLFEQTGWLEQFSDKFEFIVPDGSHELPAFTNKQQLIEIGLNTLVEDNQYETDAIYREWGADFDWFVDIQNGISLQNISMSEMNRRTARWDRTLEYIQRIVKKYGPFDGVSGFCEGATTMSVALHLQAAYDENNCTGMDLGLSKTRFFVGMAPWRSPFFDLKGLFSNEKPLQIPYLQIVGREDMSMFKSAAVIFQGDFTPATEYVHPGKHVYPLVSSSLKKAVLELLNNLKSV